MPSANGWSRSPRTPARASLLTAPGALAPIGVEDGTLVGGAPIVVVDGPATADADLWQMPDIDESALALLQYTSGSTGMPQGCDGLARQPRREPARDQGGRAARPRKT